MRMTKEEFQRQLLALGNRPAPAAPSGEDVPGVYPGRIGWSPRESSQWSLLRAVRAAIEGDWSKAGFEREVSRTIAERAGRELHAGSFFLPMDLPAAVPVSPQEFDRQLRLDSPAVRAPYQVGTAVQGGNLNATQLWFDSFIEVLRNQSVTAQLGATILSGLVGNVNIPRQSAATSTFWVAESGAVTEAEATFDQVQLRPRTVGALSKMSRLMLKQGTPAIEQIARQDLMAQLILAIDLAAISGTGASNQPTGIVNQAGVGSVIGGTNGANFSFDLATAIATTTRVANAPQQALGFALNARTYNYLSSLKSSDGHYLWSTAGNVVDAPPDRLRGYKYAVSNQLRSNLVKGASGAVCSEIVFGAWQELLIGEWGTLEIAVNPYDSTGFANGDVLLRALQTIDIGVRHGASFAVMSDALTPGF
jgi:HK97 family phage major capsid protein